MFVLISETLNKYLLYGGVLFVLLLAAAIVLTFFLSKRSDIIFAGKIQDSSNSIRVFRLDIQNDRTDYYNASSIRRRRSSSLTNFYNMFPSNERERLIDWIGALLDKDSGAPQTLEISVIVRRNRKKYFTLLQVTKIDYEHQIIHLESHLLRFMNVSRSKRNNEGFYKFSTQTGLSAALKAKPNRGFTCCVKFFRKNSMEKITRLDFVTIKNALVPFISKDRLMIEYGEDEIFICDFKASIRGQVVQALHMVETEARRRMSVHASVDYLQYSIGVVENRLVGSDLEKIIEEGEKLAATALEEGVSYLFYEEDGEGAQRVSSQNYRTEVERIIYDKRFQYLYRPVYDVGRQRVIGYQSIIKPLDSFFGSIEELKNYAYKTNDDRELFSTLARNAISRFIQQKSEKNHTLFFDVTYNEMAFVARTLSHIQGIKETKVVICINEQDFLDLPSMSTDSIIAMVTNLRSNGYPAALRIKDKSDLTLLPKIYETFDYFIIESDTQINSRSFNLLPILQNLIENLLKFNKTLVAEDMLSWDAVELLVRLGVEIVSSDVIGPSDENVLPIAKKTTMKLDKIIE